jgi:hypothetical protein
MPIVGGVTIVGQFPRPQRSRVRAGSGCAKPRPSTVKPGESALHLLARIRAAPDRRRSARRFVCIVLLLRIAEATGSPRCDTTLNSKPNGTEQDGDANGEPGGHRALRFGCRRHDGQRPVIGGISEADCRASTGAVSGIKSLEPPVHRIVLSTMIGGFYQKTFAISGPLVIGLRNDSSAWNTAITQLASQPQGLLAQPALASPPMAFRPRR